MRSLGTKDGLKDVPYYQRNFHFPKCKTLWRGGGKWVWGGQAPRSAGMKSKEAPGVGGGGDYMDAEAGGGSVPRHPPKNQPLAAN